MNTHKLKTRSAALALGLLLIIGAASCSKNKYKNIKAKNDYERSMKLIRFALGRGYSMDVIHKCIDKMKEEDLGDIDFEEEF